MRRFLIWTVLIVVVGLALAGGGYWAYWNFYSRFQPVVITENQAEVQHLLDEAPWVSAGSGGAPLYIIGYRDSASTQRYEREEVPKLRAGGVDPRLIVFARADVEGQAQSTPAERATVAELWLGRDWNLHQRWMQTPPGNWTAAGIQTADGDLARSAVVDAGRQFVAQLSGLLGKVGASGRYPLIVWRDRDGFMKACACADARSWAFIRDDFNAPDAAAPGGVDPADPGARPGSASPQDGAAQTLPYPSLTSPGTQPAPGSTNPVPTTPGAATRPTPVPTPTRPATPPQPTQQDDSTFF